MAELTDLVRQVIYGFAGETKYNLNTRTYWIQCQSDAKWALRRLGPFLNLRGLQNWCSEAKSHLDWNVLFIPSGYHPANACIAFEDGQRGLMVEM